MCLNKPKRGIYEISPLGIEKIANPENINNSIAVEFPKKQNNKPAKTIKQLTTKGESLTPKEELYASAEKIRESRYQEIIDTILSKTPREFKKNGSFFVTKNRLWQ